MAADFCLSVGEKGANTSCLVLFVIGFFMKRLFSRHETPACFSKMN